MNEKELLEYMTPAQLDYLGKFMDDCNREYVLGKDGTRNDYTVNDISISDVVPPENSIENKVYYAVLRPDDHLNEVGMLSVLMVERVGDTWIYGAVIDGKVMEKPIETGKLMLLFPYKPEWPRDKWILLPKEEPCDAPAG